MMLFPSPNLELAMAHKPRKKAQSETRAAARLTQPRNPHTPKMTPPVAPARARPAPLSENKDPGRSPLVDRMVVPEAQRADPPDSAAVRKLAHDLHVQRIELETQNRELHQARQALEAARDRYADLYDFAPVGYLTFDAEGHILELNLTAAAMLGRERTRIVGKPFTLWVAKDDTRAFFDHLRLALETSDTTVTDIRISGRHRQMLDVRLKSMAVADARSNDTHCRTILFDTTERKRAEEALRQSEANYRSLIENIPDVTWTTDEHGTTVFISANVERVYGYAADEVYASGTGLWLDRIHDDDRDRVRQAYRALFDTGALYDIEYRIQRKDGEWIWLHDRAFATYEKTGRRYADGIFSDITERKRAEAALRESEEYFRRTFDQSPIGAAVAGLDYRFQRVNAALCRITGYSEQELTAIGFEDITHPEDLAADRERAQRLLAGEYDQYQMDRRYVRKDGNTVWVRLSVRVIRDQTGQPLCFLPMMEDITDRKRVDEALRKQRDFAESLIATAPAIVLVLDRQARIVRFNPYMENLTGYRLDEVKGQDWLATFLPQDDHARIREVFAAAISEQPTHGNVNPIVTKSGALRYIEWYDTTLKDSDGNVTGLLSVGQDITERRNVEEQLRLHQERLAHVVRLSTLNELATGLAHEINQPLTAIITYAQECARRLRAHDANPDVLLGALEQVAAQAHRAGDIIQHLRDFMAKRQPQRSAADINDIARRAVKLAESEAQRSAARLRLALAERLPPVRIDPIQIEQVILNLLRNSLEALDGVAAGRRDITLRTSTDDDTHIRIVVEDRGPGVTSRHPNTVFDPFVTTKADSLGMGLAISRSIVEAHGGRIGVENRPEGGARSWFTLPVK